MADRDGVGLNRLQLTTRMSISLGFRPAKTTRRLGTVQEGVNAEKMFNYAACILGNMNM